MLLQAEYKRGYLTELLWAVVVVLMLQLVFATYSSRYKPNMEILAEVPSATSAQLFSLGDEQFYFRLQALRLQNSGDQFGGLTPLKDYDYALLYRWFKFLDTLDHRSNVVPNLAASHFSQTPVAEDTYHVIKYLEEHAAFDPEKNWWWIYHASFIARNKYGDKDWALRLGRNLSQLKSPDIPIWAIEYAAFLYEQEGQQCEAYAVIQGIVQEISEILDGNYALQEDEYGGKYYQLASGRKISTEEIEFLNYYVRERLTELNSDGKFNPEKCRVKHLTTTAN